MLDAGDHDQLLRELAEIVARIGGARFVGAPLVLPTARFFPEASAPGPEGARTLARRLLAFVDLPHLHVRVDDHRDPGQAGPPCILLDSLSEDAVRLHLLADGFGAWRPYVLAHEVARIALVRASAGLDGAPRDPYRGEQPADLQECYETMEPSAAHQREVSMAALCHGLGVLTVNGADLYRAEETMGGRVVATFVSLKVGGLAPAEASYLLAVQMVVRALPADQRRAVLDALTPDRSAEVRRFVEELLPARAALLARLALGPEEDWPPPASLIVEPLARVEPASPSERAASPRRPDDGGLVFRVPGNFAAQAGAGGALLGIALVVSALATCGVQAWIAVLAAPVVLVPWRAGVAYGRSRRWERCSAADCETVLPENAKECAGCGAKIATEAQCMAADERASQIATAEYAALMEDAGGAPESR